MFAIIGLKLFDFMTDRFSAICHQIIKKGEHHSISITMPRNHENTSGVVSEVGRALVLLFFSCQEQIKNKLLLFGCLMRSVCHTETCFQAYNMQIKPRWTTAVYLVSY